MQIISKKLLATAAGFGFILVAVGLNAALSKDQRQTPPPQSDPQYPVVSITQTSPLTHMASVTAYGEVKSRNQLELTSQVSGKITYLSAAFLTGNTFKKGELLAQIEPIPYRQAVANAQATLADAKLALAQEKLNSAQAAQEWKQSGLANEQASDLVLRKPQLAVAQAKYNVATEALVKAEYDLAQTKLTAPFDALVVSKQVQMGSNVQTGTVLAELYDIALFEVSLPLSSQQWQLLPTSQNPDADLSGINVQLCYEVCDETSQSQWSATVERFEQHIDGQSRQRALVATIEQPISLDTPLFPGTFVKATINGQQISQLWKLPASALIDNNTVWQVNDQDLLAHLPVKLMFSQDNAVYVKPLDGLTQARIVKRPLSSYLVNMKVEAVVEADVEEVL